MATKDNDKADLIPDYCNNRLDAQAMADFAELLEQDQDLRDQYNEFREFQELYRGSDPDEPVPSDALFTRITTNISAQHSARRTVEKKAVAQANPLGETIRAFWQQLRESIAVPWVLAAAQAAVIVLLVVQAPHENTYSTLSATTAVATADTVGINVVFRPNAMETDIRALLLAIEGSVTGGPSMEGRYVVTISKQRDLANVVQALKESEIVLFAEPVS